MGFKKTTRSLDFADLALATCLEQNRETFAQLSVRLYYLCQKCLNFFTPKAK